ncbi:aldehyde ferredoxin oxidoreductase N-terminal domain-containing protein [Thermodesulfobacteriota bacterium]
MDSRGFAGHVLTVDLTDGAWETSPFDVDLGSKLLGGFGMNSLMAYRHLQGGEDPFSEENPIILGCGPLVGTMTPGSSRLMATTKQPANNTVSPSAGSMSFGPKMKWAGYDHIIITGISETPVYLLIEDDTIELRDARDLWGRDIHETTEELWRRHGDVGVIATGQAGEKLIRYALCLVDRTATLGRGGLGAVMGSKRLKAIAVRGRKGIKISDSKGFFHLTDQLFERVKAFSGHPYVTEYGMMSGWGDQKHILFHSLKTDWEEFEKAFGMEAYRTFRSRRAACPSCFIPCKDVIEFEKNGETRRSFPTSYLNIPLMGFLFTSDASEAAFLLDRLNRLGIDFMTFCTLARWAIDCYQTGGISDALLKGKRIDWDAESVFFILDLVLQREGLGEVLAEGWAGVIDRFGKDAVQGVPLVKHQDTLFEPRASGLGTMEFEQVVCPRGPTSAMAGSPTYVPGVPVDKFKRHLDRMGIPQDAINRIFDPDNDLNVGRLSRYSEDWYTVFCSLGICMRSHNNRFYSAGLCAELYEKATGIPMDREELMRAAERAWTLFKLANVREGFDRKDDIVPEAWFQPLDSYGEKRVMTNYYKDKELGREDLLRYVDDYYKERGWDLTKGGPTKEKLQDIGLGDIVNI